MKRILSAFLLLAVTSGCAIIGTETETDSPGPKYIRSWLICAPFPGRRLTKEEREKIRKSGYPYANRLRGGFFEDYLKESGGESGVTPEEGDAVKTPKGKIVKWKKYDTDSGVVSYGGFFNTPYTDDGPWPYHVAVMYAYTIIESDTDRKVFLEIGTDDSGKAYVNGKLVHNDHKLHGWSDKSYVPINLKKGKNSILVKVEDCGGPGGFIAGISKEAPTPVLTLSRDTEDFNAERNVIAGILNDNNYKWAHWTNPNGDILIYGVFPQQLKAARKTIRKAIKDDKLVHATMMEK